MRLLTAFTATGQSGLARFSLAWGWTAPARSGQSTLFFGWARRRMTPRVARPCPDLEPSPLTTSIPNYRLWFQLTRTIESFFAVPSSQPFRIDLYEQFIRDFGGKLDPLKHAAIAVSVARSYEGERRCS
jgi:hypothetical protein